MRRKSEKKLLITGGAGFIGSTLVLALQDTYDIICFGRGTGFDKLKKMAHKNVAFVRGDVVDEAALARCVKDVDYVVHLVGGGGNVACLEDPVWALGTHIRGTRTLVKLAAAQKVKKFIFSSSYQVYGSSRRASVTEATQPKPESFYANLKLLAEQLIADSGVNYTILRFANMYGYSRTNPLQKSGAIDNFVRACLSGNPIRVQGTGEQTIDYLHIQDAVSAILSALAKSSVKSVCNIGSGQVITVKKLAKTVQNVYQELQCRHIPIKRVTQPKKGMNVVRMSITKAHRELGWRPTVNLETGITELIHKNSRA